MGGSEVWADLDGYGGGYGGGSDWLVLGGGGLIGGYGGVVRLTVGGRGWGVGYRTGGGGVHTDSVRRALSAMARGCYTLCGGGYAGLYYSLRMPWCGVCIGQGCSMVWQGQRMGGVQVVV